MMSKMEIPHNISLILALFLLCTFSFGSPQFLSPIAVKDVTNLGMQQTSYVTNVSRDGGYSVLINGNIVWLYDDTECMDFDGNLLSFISNSAAYAYQPKKNLLAMADFGVVMVGKDRLGRKKNAILPDSAIGTGGWIPLERGELEFNKKLNGKERIAICTFPKYRKH